MNKKYKELLAFETNEFKTGDRVECYGQVLAKGTVVEVGTGDDSYLIRVKLDINLDPDSFIWEHFKACRKLEEITPREFNICLDINGDLLGIAEFQGSKLDIVSRVIKVREVLDEEGT